MDRNVKFTYVIFSKLTKNMQKCQCEPLTTAPTLRLKLYRQTTNCLETDVSGSISVTSCSD